MGFLKKIDGLKTHGVVAVYLLCIALEKGAGADVPGFEAGQDWLNEVWVALGVSGLRDALRKYGGKLLGGLAS